MALEPNAVCDVCGRPYRMCGTCQEITTFKPWRTVADSLPHFMIYTALHDYTVNKNKATAKELLEKCDLSELETFRAEVKKIIHEIMDDQEQPKNVAPSSPKKINSKKYNIE